MHFGISVEPLDDLEHLRLTHAHVEVVLPGTKAHFLGGSALGADVKPGPGILAYSDYGEPGNDAASLAKPFGLFRYFAPHLRGNCLSINQGSHHFWTLCERALDAERVLWLFFTMARELIDLHIHLGGAVAPHILWSIAHQPRFKLPVHTSPTFLHFIPLPPT